MKKWNKRFLKGTFLNASFFVTSCLLHFHFSTIAQSTNIGTPFITNYPNEVYRAGTQTWQIEQHPNGFIFFANNNGLLQFDGINWEVFPLANKTIARSIFIDGSEKIYVGGQGEFGYFQPDERGLLVFHTLLDLVPKKHRNFADVWKIVEANGLLYFQAYHKIFCFNGTDISVIEKGKIDFLGKADNRLFVRNNNGLHEIIGDKIIPLKGGEAFSAYKLQGVKKIGKNNILFATFKKGLVTYNNHQLKPFANTKTNAFLSKMRLTDLVYLNTGQVAIGTENGGVIIMGLDGKIFNFINRSAGLQNNHVLSLFKDKQHNLWLGLDNGIAYIATNSAFTKLHPDKNKGETAYAAKIYKDNLYLGTSKGLFYRPWKDYFNPLKPKKFELFEGTEGQVWGLDLIENDLFMGHHEKGTVFNPSQVISSSEGNWKFISLKKHPGYYLLGTYDGLILYQKKGKKWIRIRAIEELRESCRIMEEDNLGNVWIAHPYRGIYKIVFNEDLTKTKVKLYGQEQGLPSYNLNHVFKINKEIVFTGETGVFKYNMALDQFLPHRELTNLMGEHDKIRRFFEDKDGNIWFVTAKETGLLKIKDEGVTKSFSKIIYPQLKNKLVRGHEMIYPYDEHNVFICAEKGFIHFDPSKNSTQPIQNISPNIVKVTTINEKDSVLVYGHYHTQSPQLLAPLPYANNALRFSYASTNYESHNHILFATKLEGFDETWSEWSDKAEKEFTNLNSGDYRFLVKAKLRHGKESEMASFDFTIKPPWYASFEAIIAYIVLSFLFLATLILVPRKQYEEEKAQLESAKKRQEEEHLRQVEKSENEIISLKNKQLEIEINHKNRELAMSTMHLVQHNELIQQLKDSIIKVSKTTKDPKSAAELRKLERLLIQNSKLTKVWDHFAHNFDQIHIDFIQKIREKYPDLSPNDEKLCAYLRLNLSTKDIAPLMNISIRGVEVARYRLRKKMRLDSTVNLNKFMMKF